MNEFNCLSRRVIRLRHACVSSTADSERDLTAVAAARRSSFRKVTARHRPCRTSSPAGTRPPRRDDSVCPRLECFHVIGSEHGKELPSEYKRILGFRIAAGVIEDLPDNRLAGHIPNVLLGGAGHVRGSLGIAHRELESDGMAGATLMPLSFAFAASGITGLRTSTNSPGLTEYLRPCARSGARKGHRVSRSQAGQRQYHAGRRREGLGLRVGQDDPAELHHAVVARAGEGKGFRTLREGPTEPLSSPPVQQ
jgi:hypothetical protein